MRGFGFRVSLFGIALACGCTELRGDTDAMNEPPQGSPEGGLRDGAAEGAAGSAPGAAGAGSNAGSSGGEPQAGAGGSGGPSSDGGAGSTSDEDGCVMRTFYPDADGDGYGDPDLPVQACAAPEGHVADGEDCDDACADCFLDNPARCDDLDNDCDGNADEFPNLGDPCESGVGACRMTGTFVCDGAATGTVCSASAGTGTAEVCANEIDDDCDGDTDEAPEGGCCEDDDCASSDRCSAGSCVPRTWCELQSRPSGVAQSDYQCLDFEGGFPPSPWTTLAAGQGTVSSSTARALSAPNSMRSHVDAETVSGNAADRGKLTWTAVGATPVASVSLSASVQPVTAPAIVDDSGYVDLLCIDNTVTSFCVAHITTSGYTGLLVVEKRTMDGASQAYCDVHPSWRTLPANVWTRLELRTSTGGPVALFVNGTQAEVASCSLRMTMDTTVTPSIGLRAWASTATAYTAHFDNVVTAVRR